MNSELGYLASMTVVERQVIGNQHILRGGLSKQTLQTVTAHGVVGIEQCQPLAFGNGYSGVARCGRTAVRLQPDKLNAKVGSCTFSY